MNAPIRSYATCLIISQGKNIFEDLAKGTSIKKGPCAVVTQELECVLNLHVLSVLLVNRYYRPKRGGFLCLEISSEYIIVLYQQCVGIMVPILLCS